MRSAQQFAVKEALKNWLCKNELFEMRNKATARNSPIYMFTCSRWLLEHERAAWRHKYIGKPNGILANG